MKPSHLNKICDPCRKARSVQLLVTKCPNLDWLNLNNYGWIVYRCVVGEGGCVACGQDVFLETRRAFGFFLGEDYARIVVFSYIVYIEERLYSYAAFSKLGTNGGLGCTAQY